MRPFAFIARCQRFDIYKQYELGVRSFDLRIRFEKGRLIVAHGFMEYDITEPQLWQQLEFLNQHKCYLRILHEVRNKKQYTSDSTTGFYLFCNKVELHLKGITPYHGKNLYNWTNDYTFNFKPTEDERYSSVTAPKLIDDWLPWLYAKLHNRKILAEGTDADILSIDFVDIQ